MEEAEIVEVMGGGFALERHRRILGPSGQECCDKDLNWKMLETFGDQDFRSKVTLPWESVF